MAIYRNVHMSFWTDPVVVEDFTPEDKYFFIYILTNPHTNLCGCYEISMKQIADEIGYNIDSVKKLVQRFIEVHKKINYNYQTKELIIYNWHKYNWTKSPKFIKPLSEEIERIKCIEFKQYLHDILEEKDTVSIPYQYGSDTTVTVTVSDTVSDNTVNNNINNNIDTKTNNNIDTKTNNNIDTKTNNNIDTVNSFEEFWNNYPKKEHRYLAEQEYCNLLINGVEPQWLTDAAKEYAKCTDGMSTKFIKYPENWLKERLYLDYPPGTYERKKSEQKAEQQNSKSSVPLPRQQEIYQQQEESKKRHGDLSYLYSNLN